MEEYLLSDIEILTISKPDDCERCEIANETGYWGSAEVTHCRQCHRSWPMASSQAHCAGCHRHFARSGVFDQHFGPGGEHKDPQHKRDTYEQDDYGTWHGVMREEAKAALGIHSAPDP